MSKTWRCGDCGAEWPKSVHRCRRPFDDYLSLRGGSIENAITRAVDSSIAPIVKRAENRLRGVTQWREGNVHHWRWTA